MNHLASTEDLDWNISDLSLNLAKKEKLCILLQYNQLEKLLPMCKHGINIKMQI